MIKSLFTYSFITIIYIVNTINVNGQVINTAGCGCDYVVQPNDLYIDGNTVGVGPGDVVCVAASNKRYLGFINFHGAPGNPIIFKNCGGPVIIKDTDWYYGIKFDNCSYFHFTGTGSADEYGFIIDGTPTGISGVGIAKLSTDFEVDHIKVSRTGFAGIVAKSDPDCTGIPNYGNFVQKNTVIHDNFILNVEGEGIFLGYPHYRGNWDDGAECGGTGGWVKPHELVGVKVYNNKIMGTGKEGLQVGCAVSGVEIYDNNIFNYGTRNMAYQKSGVHLSTGTTGNFYRNKVSNGTGAGILLNGHGDNFIFNNIVSNTGEDGFMIYDSIVVEGKPYNIVNNTIVNSGGNGMKVYTTRNTIFNFVNNIIAGTGGELMSVPGGVAFNNSNNVAEKNAASLHFEDLVGGNYHLTAVSPAVDAGMNMASAGVVDDYELIVRPRGKDYDAGAFESPHERLIIGYDVYPNPIYLTKKNLPPRPNVTTVTIRFVIPETSEGSLKIYDTHGRVVGIVAEGPFTGGQEYKIEFNSFYLATGMYFYILETKDGRQIKKMIQIE
jgi:parallel beta-helix repeat protein